MRNIVINYPVKGGNRYMAVNTRLPKVTQYIKNVGKSVAFASIEVIKENSSGISDFLEANSDIMKEGYASIKN